MTQSQEVGGKWRGMGRLSRRLFLLTLFALLPATIVLSYNLYTIRAATEQEVHDEALRMGQLGSLELQRIISGAENVMIALSAEPSIYDKDVADCKAYLRRLGGRLPQFTGIALTDAAGTVVCSQSDAALGVSLADRDYVKRAISTGAFTVGAYMIGRITKLPVLPLALPVQGDNGKLVGVVIAPLRLDWLNEKLSERKAARQSALLVVDRSQTIIARIPNPEKYVGTVARGNRERFVIGAPPGTFLSPGMDGVERIVGYYPAADPNLGLYVGAGISTDQAYGPIRHAFWISVIATVSGLLLSIILAWATSAQLIRRPVDKLITTIGNWRGGDEAARTAMSEQSGELGIVGKAMDEFLDELVAARRAAAMAEQSRELLVHELDHRIKNLLATVQSVAQQTFRDAIRPEEAAVIFRRRLNALSQAHALLMRADGQSADMRDVVAAAISPFLDEATPQFDIDGPGFPVKVKAVLSLSMALHELCTNAVKYGALSRDGGRVTITWSIYEAEAGGQDPSRFRLVWTESGGPPVSAPETIGFGTKMIERILGYELEADVETTYAVSGLEFVLVAQFARIRLTDQK